MSNNIKWTAAQEAAMNIRGKTLLVSAAAGSGKTATLTERIIRRITDKDSPADISKMLIVTFTRAAASELRVKILSALSIALAQNPSNSHLSSQLMKTGSAKICTIDSFYFDIVKANIASLGMSGAIRIADDGEYIILAQAAMEKAIDQMYEDYADFPSFVECFGSARQSNNISDIFLNIHKKLESVPEGIEFVRDCAEKTFNDAQNDFFDTSYGKILQQNTKDLFNHYFNAYSNMVATISSDEAINKAYGSAFRDDLEFCKSLCSAVNNSEHGYSQIRELLLSHSFEALGKLTSANSTEQSVRFKAKRDEFKKCIISLREKSFSKSAQTISRAMLDTAKHLSILYRLLLVFDKIISDEKEKLGILTFSDIRRKTLDLLVNKDGSPTDIAKAYSEQYTDIYIDEYQDVDGVQDLIFSSIAKSDNRFMVGDIKQSIYEFRGAEPRLFSSYLSKFPYHDSNEADSSDSVSLFMSENFRCDKNIIDFTNLVCSKIFYSIAESIRYTSDDELKFSKKCAPTYVSPKVKIAVVTTPSKSEQESREADEILKNHDFEAEYIAQEIERLIKNGVKADGSRILPKDIAVLFRASSTGDLVAAALKKRGILSSQSDAKKYFENPDVLTVLCVLNTIDNPQRDIFLAGTLRSPLFNFNMEELVKLRISVDKSLSLYDAVHYYSQAFNNELSNKCLDFILTIEGWQNDAASVAVDKFLQILFDSERFVASGLVSQQNDSGDGGNILLLYEYARRFERDSFKGLYQFIEYINSLIEKGETFSVGDSLAADDRVRLMTIHKSKGLEFPVCFLCNATHPIRSQEIRDSLVLDYPLGIAMKLSEESGLARINTPMRETVLSQISRRQSQEEMRLLYVALTRAREMLYVTAASSKLPQKLLDGVQSKLAFFDKYTVTKICQSYLDWILLSCSDEENPTYQLQFINANDICSTEFEDTPEETKQIDADPILTEKLKDSFAFEYPFKALSRVPSKISVSRLYPDILDEAQESLELFTDVPSAKIPDFFLEKKPTSANAAERGTATHLFLQFCDFKNAYDKGVKEELSRLQSKKFLPPNAELLIYTDELERFFKSEFIKEILSAKKIIREQRFNIELSSESFTKQEALREKMKDEKLAVQGVIDLIVIDSDGNISLYDYKTDRLSPQELNDASLASQKMNSRHGLQLSYYAKAVSLLFGKECSRVAVYSTHSSKLYNINLLKELIDDSSFYKQ